MKDKNFCATAYNVIIKLWLVNLIGFFNSTRVCYENSMCASHIIIPDSNKRYINRVLIDRPPKHNYTMPIANFNDNDDDYINFAVLTDIHVDQNYTTA